VQDRWNICAVEALGFHDKSRKDNAMASAAGQKPLILTAVEADHQRAEIKARLAESRIKAPEQRSSGPIAYAVAALILLVAGYFLFNGNWNTMMLFPTVSETVPSPDINSTVAPVPSPPPAEAPATNP
jgi:hypothetical protein